MRSEPLANKSEPVSEHRDLVLGIAMEDGLRAVIMPE